MNFDLRDEKRSRQAVFIALFITGMALYANTLSISIFHYDDIGTIYSNPVIRNMTDIKSIWEGFNTRFLGGLSFAFNYWLGELNLFGYRLLSVFLHVVTAFLVFLFVNSSLRIQKQHPSLRDKALLLSFISALIFLVHPVQTECINFLTQRYALLAGLFYLLSFNLYLKARNKPSRFAYGAFYLSCIATMFTKENVVTLPAALLAYERILFGPFNNDMIKRLKPILPVFFIILLVPLTRLNASGNLIPTARVEAKLIEEPSTPRQVKAKFKSMTKVYGAQLSRKEYFYSQLNVMREYIRILFLPVNQNISYDYPASLKWSEPRTILSGAFLACVFLLSCLTWRLSPIVSFGIMWFFITLSVESTFISNPILMTEYRLYLPGVGFAMLLPVAVFHLNLKEKQYLALMLALVAVYGFAAIKRNAVWRSDVTLWQDSVNKAPHNARSLTNLGAAYRMKRQYDKALENFYKAVTLNPNSYVAYCNIGQALSGKGEFGKALGFYQKALAINPRYEFAYFGLAFSHGALGDYEEEVKNYYKALEVNPYFDQAYFQLLKTFVTHRDKEKALSLLAYIKGLGRKDLADVFGPFIEVSFP